MPLTLKPVLAFAALALAATAVVVAQPHAALAAPPCGVTYTVNQWTGGFTADVKVTNNAAPVTSWTLTWTFAGDQRITSAWNATVTQNAASVSAASLAWNGSLGTGASASFGFQGTFTGTTATPTNFAVNGTPCTDSTTPPTTAPPTTTPPTTAPPTTTPPTTAPPTTPPPTTTPPPSGAGTDGFEGQAAGAPRGAWAVSYPDCSGAGTATIDKTVAHGGTTSLRVDGAAGYCNHVFVRNTSLLPTTSTLWYVRYWVRHTTALPAAHIATVAMQDAADSNKDLRFGGQNAALQWNRASDDATLPEQSPAGVALSAPLPVNTWNCVEFKVDGGTGTMETWLNGTSVPGLVEDGVPTHDIDSQWLNRTWRPRLTDLRLGWESYGEGADTLWYDDVAVATSRIGC
jgi:hypothetical protein